MATGPSKQWYGTSLTPPSTQKLAPRAVLVEQSGVTSAAMPLLDVPVLDSVLDFVSDGNSLREVGSSSPDLLEAVRGLCRRSAPELKFVWEPLSTLGPYTVCSGYRGDGSSDFPYLLDEEEGGGLVRHSSPCVSLRLPVRELLAATAVSRKPSAVQSDTYPPEVLLRLQERFGAVAELEAVSDLAAGWGHNFVMVTYLRLAAQPSYQADWYVGTVRLGSIVRVVLARARGSGLELLPGFCEKPRWPYDLCWLSAQCLPRPPARGAQSSFASVFLNYQPSAEHLEVQLFALEPLNP